MKPSSVVVAVLAAAIVLGNLPCRAAERRSGVEFYLLKDEGLSFETVRKMPLADLALQDKPWIASEIMIPQLGVGAFTPSPMKLRNDSVKI